MRLAVARVNAGRPADAVAAYETAVRLNPADAALREQFAQVLNALGRAAEALVQLERAAEIRRSGR
jgi:protein involved in temperature-dependent protein secretion